MVVMIRKDFRRNFAARHPLFRLEDSDTGGGLTAAELAGAGGNTVSKKASMTAGVSRKLKHATAIIDGVGKGVFPAR